MVLDYNQIIEESLRELQQRLTERDETDMRIGQLVRALRGLAPMLPEKERADLFNSLQKARRKSLGLTQVILYILRESDVPLNNADIRDRMKDAGFDLSKYSQANATIYNTLRRLMDTKRVVSVFPKDNTKVLQYRSLTGEKLPANIVGPRKEAPEG
jgi:hypothetical protein